MAAASSPGLPSLGGLPVSGCERQVGPVQEKSPKGPFCVELMAGISREKKALYVVKFPLFGHGQRVRSFKTQLQIPRKARDARLRGRARRGRGASAPPALSRPRGTAAPRGGRPGLVYPAGCPREEQRAPLPAAAEAARAGAGCSRSGPRPGQFTFRDLPGS